MYQYSLQELTEIYHKVDYRYYVNEKANRAKNGNVDSVTKYYMEEKRKTEKELEKEYGDDVEMFYKAYEKMSKSQNDKNHASLYFIEKYLENTGHKTKTSNTKEIEKEVARFLREQYKNCEIVKEYTSWENPVRADILAINVKDLKNPVIAVEIKGNKDNFERIYKQLYEYKKFSTTVYVALDVRHLRKFVEKYGYVFWDVGILAFHNGRLELYKEPKIVKGQQYIDFLWGGELKLFIDKFKGKSKLPYKSKESYKEIIKVLFAQKEIEENSKRLFVRRLSDYKIEPKLIGLDHTDRQKKIFDMLLDSNYWIGDGEIDLERLYEDMQIAKQEKI